MRRVGSFPCQIAYFQLPRAFIDGGRLGWGHGAGFGRTTPSSVKRHTSNYFALSLTGEGWDGGNIKDLSFVICQT